MMAMVSAPVGSPPGSRGSDPSIDRALKMKVSVPVGSLSTNGSTDPSAGRALQQLVLGLFIASGAAGLIYQVVWSRELVLLFGNTSQAISTIVTAFLAGLGAGALVGGRLATRSRNREYQTGLTMARTVLALSLIHI